jgi:hypothetical protein
MSTFSPAIAYATTLSQVSTGNIPHNSSISGVVIYENTNPKSLDYYEVMTARCTSTGGSSAQLEPTGFDLQVWNPDSATWFTIGGGFFATGAQSYTAAGIAKAISPGLNLESNSITTPLKVRVPYRHRIIANFANSGGNSATYDIFGLIEKYLST